MNVLWLASWYPNRTNITNGDFIERHAVAVVPFVNSLTIISAVKDETLAYNKVKIDEQKNGNITTYIIYYGRSRWGGVVEKFLSLKKYIALHLELFDKITNEKGKPDLVHVHVAMKAGLVAKKIKQQYNIPYIITEHWTAYYKEAKPNIYEMGGYFTRQTKSVLQNASLLLAVSNELGKTINKNLLAITYRVVPNVVDTNLFYPSERNSSDITRMVHVSNMSYQKNMEAIVDALAGWKQSGGNFIMQVYGHAPSAIIERVAKNNLEKKVIFNGEVLQPVLCAAVRDADALVLYSRYETFGCVIIEANACGTPVILSNLDVFHELVTENENGIFVEPGNPVALAGAFESFEKLKNSFNRRAIVEKAKEKFSYAAVGKQIKDVYDKIKKG